MPHWSVALLFCWLWFHRLVVHGGIKDLLDARHGSSPFTTWSVVVETILMASLAVVGGWMQWHAPWWPAMVAGNVLLAVACGVGYSARRTIGEHFSIHLTTATEHQLVTAGVYGKVRHPVYAGDLLFHLGVPLVTCSYEVLALAPIYFLLIRQRMATEEQMLAARYSDYPAYMARTSRLIPGIY